MKKTFFFNVQNKVPERQIESIRHDIKKYIARERRKPAPKNGGYWGFDCKIGENIENAVKIHVGEIFSKINEYYSEKKDSFYVEILAKPEHKPEKKIQGKNNAKN